MFYRFVCVNIEHYIRRRLSTFWPVPTTPSHFRRYSHEIISVIFIYFCSGRGMPRGGMMNPMPRGFNGPPMRGRGGMMRGPPRGMGFR